MATSEVWKDVVGYEGIYQVSNKGNVYSVERTNSRGIEVGGRTLKPIYNKGYNQVGLYKNGKMETKQVHRIVAEAFIINPNGFPQVNHKDEVKDNNNVENLEWCTSKHNVNHGTRIERITQKKSKKVMAVNVETGEVLTFNSITEAGRRGYSIGCVSLASRGVYYGGNLYKGYRWYYEEGE